MRFQRLIILSIVFVIILTSFSSIISVSSASLNTDTIVPLKTPDSHVIEGVPYVSQEVNLYCAFASFTMLLDYIDGVNVDLKDVLFYSGVGYSVIYPGMDNERLPLGGVYCSQITKFLTNLFGVSPNPRDDDKDSIPEDERWQEFWIRVKQNISNNIPILTSVDPLKLSSFRKIANLPNFVWDLMPEGGHAIVIVGYNDSNGSVCYNDPGAGIFGHPEWGTYAWMNIKDFDEAVSGTIGPKYAVLTFKKVAEPLSKQEAFNKSHARNIERLKGNLSAYDEYYLNLYQGHEFGLNGLKLMKKHFDKGIQNRFKTINSYKLEGKLGILYRLIGIFGPVIAKILNLPFNSDDNIKINSFSAIGYHKSYTADFLHKNSEISSICEYEARLLENESELWNKLSSCYSIFMKKGIFLSLSRALFLMSRMKNYLDKIIEIEEKIINFGVK